MRTVLITILALAGSVTLLFAQDSAVVETNKAPVVTDHVKDASIEGLRWLSIVDSGEYDRSWTESAEIFRLALVQVDWTNQLTSVRKPLGSIVSRTFVGGEYQTSLPQAPEGEYVVLRYETKFAEAGVLVETVTPMRDPDGKWRVAGYYIAP